MAEGDMAEGNTALIENATDPANITRKHIIRKYRAVRQLTEELVAPLSGEDQCLQSMGDASPAKWHRAHTTWFFETFLLKDRLPSHKPFSKDFFFLYNSYYHTVGPQHARGDRGLISRPSVGEITEYRIHVDASMEILLANADPRILELTLLGINHEQQHQELILMDIKHAFSCNPCHPTYMERPAGGGANGTAFSSMANLAASNAMANGATATHADNPDALADNSAATPSASADNSTSAALAQSYKWVSSEGGLVEIGSPGDSVISDSVISDSVISDSVISDNLASENFIRESFAYDNETPRHQVFLQPYALSDRLVTCAEWQEFIDDGGYQDSLLWLSEGWYKVQEAGWDSPQYWLSEDIDSKTQNSKIQPPKSQSRKTQLFTLSGVRPIDPNEPVCHISYYEADAFARWAGARLPTEQEWEHAANLWAGSLTHSTTAGNFLDSGHLHPIPDFQNHATATHSSDNNPANNPDNNSITTFNADLNSPAGLKQLFGDVWEWTSSSYSPYPGFKPAAGAVGEYNGKFMVNQQVLRGGCCVTPTGHVRNTYRNYFGPHTRWHFSGLRLAKDLG